MHIAIKAVYLTPRKKNTFSLLAQHYKMVNRTKLQKMLEQAIENVKAEQLTN
jgi:hypothetical protein